MSTNFEGMKKTTNNCDDLSVKMKTNGKLICGCGGDNEFEYDPNLFDCRLFGLFLRKAENSHKKYRGILSKLNLLETAIFENKETGDSSVIEQKVRNIIDQFSDINLNNQTRTFITKYMTDKSKRKEEYNRYQLMSTLQSALNYIEVARNPQMAQLLTIVSNWVSKSDKILKGESVSQQEVNQELILKPEEVDTKFQTQAQVNVQQQDTRDIAKLSLEQEKAKQKYDKDEEYKNDKEKIDRIMVLVNTLNKALPNYFDALLSKLNDYKNRFEVLKDKFIYKKHFKEMLYSGENKRLLFDIFRKINEKMNSVVKDRTSEESKKIQKELSTIFGNYTSIISAYNVRMDQGVKTRSEFISNLYTVLLLSKELENNKDFISLMNDVKTSMKTRSIISTNLKKLLQDQKNEYSSGTSFENQKDVEKKLKEIDKNIRTSGKFEYDTDLITQLIEGKKDKEKYINFEYTESSSD